MNKATKGAITTDLVLQSAVVLPMILGHLIFIVEPSTIIFSTLAQLLAGFVQLLSGFLHSIAYRNKNRIIYFCLSMLYVFFLIQITPYLSKDLITDIFKTEVRVTLLVLVIPTLIATYYIIRTYVDYQLAKDPNNEKRNYDENLLDDVQGMG